MYRAPMLPLATAALAAITAIAAAASADTIDVAVGPGGGFGFVEQDIEIVVGDTVRWTWESSMHNVVSGTVDNPDGIFNSGPPAPAGTVFELTFDQAFVDANPVPDGIYTYYCEPHGSFGMIGSVQVMPDRPADLDGDGMVGTNDLLILIAAWGPCARCPADLDGDGMVGTNDLLILIADWG